MRRKCHIKYDTQKFEKLRVLYKKAAFNPQALSGITQTLYRLLNRFYAGFYRFYIGFPLSAKTTILTAIKKPPIAVPAVKVSPKSR